MRKLMATIGLGVILLGACGGSDDKTSSDTTAGGSVTTAASVGANVGVSGAFGDFCGARTAFNTVNPTATDLKSSLETAAANLDKAVKYAPSDIKGDVQIVATAYGKFFTAVKSANYDFTKVNPTELQAINTSDVQAAAQRITDWVAAHCK